MRKAIGILLTTLAYAALMALGYLPHHHHGGMPCFVGGHCPEPSHCVCANEHESHGLGCDEHGCDGSHEHEHAHGDECAHAHGHENHEHDSSNCYDKFGTFCHRISQDIDIEAHQQTALTLPLALMAPPAAAEEIVAKSHPEPPAPPTMERRGGLNSPRRAPPTPAFLRAEA